MNDLKKLITSHLRKAEEATAKQIAAAIGYLELQSSVNNVLNALRTEGTVECEKRKGKGNELIYWLASTEVITVKAVTRQLVEDEFATRKHNRRRFREREAGLSCARLTGGIKQHVIHH